MDKQTTATTKTKGATSSGLRERLPVMQVLFNAHVERSGAEQDDVKRYFGELLTILDCIYDDKMEAVTDTVCNLCEAYEYNGFVGGLQTAIRLVKELNG